jgi:hypothetical protein
MREIHCSYTDDKSCPYFFTKYRILNYRPYYSIKNKEDGYDPLQKECANSDKLMRIFNMKICENCNVKLSNKKSKTLG